MNYEEYLAYLATLEGMARYPYTTIVENPPDRNNEYRRPFTKEEWDKWVENERKFVNANTVLHK